MKNNKNACIQIKFIIQFNFKQTTEQKVVIENFDKHAFL